MPKTLTPSERKFRSVKETVKLLKQNEQVTNAELIEALKEKGLSYAPDVIREAVEASGVKRKRGRRKGSSPKKKGGRVYSPKRVAVATNGMTTKTRKFKIEGIEFELSVTLPSK